MFTESIVYLLRKTNLSLREIGNLTPLQFNETLKEAAFQESVDNYRNQYSIASLLAAIYNTIPRKRGSKIYRPNDFLKGDLPERNPKPQDSLDKMAEARGIKLPAKELKER